MLQPTRSFVYHSVQAIWKCVILYSTMVAVVLLYTHIHTDSCTPPQRVDTLPSPLSTWASVLDTAALLHYPLHTTRIFTVSLLSGLCV